MGKWPGRQEREKAADEKSWSGGKVVYPKRRRQEGDGKDERGNCCHIEDTSTAIYRVQRCLLKMKHELQPNISWLRHEKDVPHQRKCSMTVRSRSLQRDTSDTVLDIPSKQRHAERCTTNIIPPTWSTATTSRQWCVNNYYIALQHLLGSSGVPQKLA